MLFKVSIILNRRNHPDGNVVPERAIISDQSILAENQFQAITIASAQNSEAILKIKDELWNARILAQQIG